MKCNLLLEGNSWRRMMKKQLVGIISGSIIGIIDMIPMIVQGLTWDANLSALVMWIMIGYLYTITQLKVRPYLKGVILAYIVLLPSAIIIGWSEPITLIPIGVMTIVLGALLGFMIEWINKKILD